ncbi:MFS transporter [Kitasatospora kifunensis]|uniref:CP family cyanate transporter-like MFS transporter n=1 Tax=Kitasatospora kifunensis TaxID=58351 RepID=A0A7W7R5V9_KITKI|nr:MFS transporter [Kitasatospora kifunensis]MBB4926012.1 CP family cyanate transporter-like MFS transporter [Kitasatospora kifunensis]
MSSAVDATTEDATTEDAATKDAATAATDATESGAGSAGSSPTAAGHPRARLLGWLLAAAVALAAVNLRPVVTSLGPLLHRVRDDLHMSATVAGLLTAVPSFCFAVFGFAAPALARRFGPIVVVTAGMGAITAGVAARSFAGGTAVFLLLTALALAGVAVANVLLPVVIKRYFPDRVGSMIGLYSMALSAGTALAAAVTVPLTSTLGGSWRVGLGVWALLGGLGLLPWLLTLLLRRAGRSGAGSAGGTSAGAGAGAGAQAGTGDRLAITRSRTAWALGCFFGLQATGAYAVMGWLPQIFQDAGVSTGTSGVLLALTMAIGVPVSFVLPNWAARRGDQRIFVVGLAGCGIVAYLGLALAPVGGAWLWAVLLGLSNCAFPLTLTMIGLRARTSGGVAQLSAFAQGIGYLISIPGPILVGTLYQRTNGWYLPLAFLTVLLVPQVLIGLRAARARHIEDEVG